MERFCFVMLAHNTCADQVLYQTTIVVDEEVPTQPLERLLDAFMTGMGQL